MNLLEKYIGRPFNWLFSIGPAESDEPDPAKKLLNSMRLTAKSRFNASVRLKRLGNYSFLITTILSLGLIFIPLYQKSGLSLPYSPDVLSMLQIFLAVAVLVYSVVNATASYDSRSKILDNCGVQLKELIRTLRLDISESKVSGISIDLEKYHSKYHVISMGPENHNRDDYVLATLESPNDFKISGIPRLLSYIKSILFHAVPFVIPTSMIAFEILVITDILGVTEVFKVAFT
jgi:hypothetical protein